MQSIYSEPFCGQVIYRDQIMEIAVIVDTFPKLSRTELANTICELFSLGSGENLAGSMLSLAAKTVPHDWIDCCGRRPVLIETLVDGKKFNGTCYQAANWVHVGKTTGRGRMDRQNQRMGNARAIAVQNTDFRKGQPDRQGQFGRDLSNC